MRSAGVARPFSSYAHDFHGLAGRAAAAQEQFVKNLRRTRPNVGLRSGDMGRWLGSTIIIGRTRLDPPYSVARLAEIIENFSAWAFILML